MKREKEKELKKAIRDANIELLESVRQDIDNEERPTLSHKIIRKGNPLRDWLYVRDVKQFLRKILLKDMSCVKLNDLPQDILDMINEREIKVSYMIDRKEIIKGAGKELIEWQN